MNSKQRILSSSYWEEDKDSSLEARCYSKCLSKKIFQEDIQKTKSSELIQEKWNIYQRIEFQKMFEFYLRKTFQMLKAKNEIEWIPGRYVFKYDNNDVLSPLEYMIGVDSKFKGQNIYGRVFLEKPLLWKEENVEFLYKAYLVIEYLVEYYLKNRDMSLYYDQDIFQLAWKLKLGSPRHQDWVQWFNEFDDKSWIHLHLLEEEVEVPKTICFCIEKWYCKIRNLIGKNCILEEFFPCLQSGMKKDLNLIHQSGIAQEITSLYENPKMFIPKEIAMKILPYEFNALTSSEIKKKKEFYPYHFYSPTESQRNLPLYIIEKKDPLSPYYPRKIHHYGKTFSCILEFVFYTCFLKWNQSPIVNVENLEFCHESQMNLVFEKQFYKLIFEKMEKYQVQLALVQEKDLSQFEKEYPLYLEKQQELEECIICKGYENESIEFIHVWTNFYEFWSDDLLDTHTEQIITLFLLIFYPGLYCHMKDFKKNKEENSSLVDILSHMEEKIVVFVEYFLAKIEEQNNVQKASDVFHYIRKLDIVLQDFIIENNSKWMECITHLFLLQGRKPVHLLNINLTKNKNGKTYFLCRTIVNIASALQ
jgi:hypothetical protein